MKKKDPFSAEKRPSLGFNKKTGVPSNLSVFPFAPFFSRFFLARFIAVLRIETLPRFICWRYFFFRILSSSLSSHPRSTSRLFSKFLFSPYEPFTWFYSFFTLFLYGRYFGIFAQVSERCGSAYCGLLSNFLERPVTLL